MEDSKSNLFFNDSWNLYFHDPDNSNWGIDSYILIATITNIEEWIQINQIMKDYWNRGMFFFMREHIKPVWEDENNCKGGCISFKIWKNEVSQHLFEIVSKILGETVLKNFQDWNNICGISISPKRNYCIARIWINDQTHGDIQLYNLTIPSYARTMFKSHVDNIEQDQQL
jgi:hypothetical protein